MDVYMYVCILAGKGSGVESLSLIFKNSFLVRMAVSVTRYFSIFSIRSKCTPQEPIPSCIAIGQSHFDHTNL